MNLIAALIRNWKHKRILVSWKLIIISIYIFLNIFIKKKGIRLRIFWIIRKIGKEIKPWKKQHARNKILWNAANVYLAGPR